MATPGSLRRWLTMGALMLFGTPMPQARAMTSCISRAPETARGTQWLPPLDRILTLSTSDLPLREAIDKIAESSHIQFSYSPELLPATRVCLALERVPVGAALEALLEGVTLKPVVVGAVHVVLTPERAVAPARDSGFARSTGILDRVVVTGSPNGGLQRASVFALEVVDGATLTSHGISNLAQALELAVPGMWLWSSSPGSMSSQYASIRGASSFGTTAPKIYLDGIEVANPLLVTQLDATRIDRIEVIRGPQGAALYGADAISGVINILTRHDGTPTGAPAVEISTSAGVSQTDFAANNALVQQHSATLRMGSGTRTAGAGVLFSNVGAYVPGASEMRVLADADGRLVHSRGMLTGIARLSVQRGDASISPIKLAIGDTIGAQAMTQYTLGATASTMPSPFITLTAIAGVDGFRVNGLSTAALPVPLSLDDAVRDATGGADRYSLRLRGVARVDANERTTMTFTLGAEEAMLRDASFGIIQNQPQGNSGQGGAAQGPGSGDRLRLLSSQYANNSGVMAQMDVAWRNMLYVVAGGRLEQTVGATPTPQNAAMPLLGAAFVRDINGVTAKARVGFGRGIRPAQTLMRGASWIGRAAAAAESTLQPESQSGVEYGGDLAWGSRLSLHVTRFDQHATGLIQPVAEQAVLPRQRPGGPVPDSTRPRRIEYVLENVGAIDNRGWELEGIAQFGALSLIGWFSTIDSRVTHVADTYRGDLREGDRPLEVPARTVSVSATYSFGRMQGALTVARASDWVAYDRVAIAEALASGQQRAQNLLQNGLRAYWADYSGITRLRGSLTYRAGRRTSVQMDGDNLLDLQRNAPDNATVVTGRTLSLGIRTSF